MISMPDDHKYTMAADPGTLWHLGAGLYSDAPSAVSEAVANAWDADASRVDIRTAGDRITIQDDGCGMTVADANEKYLRVGYERREREGGKTRGGRDAMGRKGIGSLSLFAIADTVTVHSSKDGERHGFAMRVKDIESAAKSEGRYHPEPIGPAADLERGTRITLTDLKHKADPARLRERLARGFSVIGEIEDFAVSIDGDEIVVKDSGYCENLQYVWMFGGGPGRIGLETAGAKKFCEEVEIRLNGRTARLRGWMGTVHRTGQLKDAEAGDNMNKIAVMVRGRSAQEDILGEFSQGGVYSGRVVGEVHADFLDEDGDGGEDAIATGRRRINEDSPGYKALKDAVGRALQIIEQKWNELRDEEGDKKAREIPQVGEWYERLGAEHRRMAKSLFGRINRMPVGGGDGRRRLLIGGALAFESLRLRDVLDRLSRVDAGNAGMLREVFLQLDDLEASSHYQAAKSRLAVIDRLAEIADGGPIEKVVQDHLFSHLWLLDPSWERMQGTERMEKAVLEEIGALDSEHGKDGESRLDIKYAATAGKHVIIELKRPDIVVETGEVMSRVERYYAQMEEMLEREGRPNEPVEFVCVVGKHPMDWMNPDSRSRSERSLAVYSTRIVTYGEIIRNAQEAYRDYTERQDSVSRVYNLITSIEEADKESIRPSGGPGSVESG